MKQASPVPVPVPVSRMRRRVAAAGLVAAASGSLLIMDLGWLTHPRPWAEATGWDEIPAEARPADGPAWSSREPGDEPPAIAWLGHSGFVVSWHGQRLLLDPNTSPRCTVSRRVLEPAVDVGSLGRIDAVLISHAHFDHLDMPTLERLSEVGRMVLPAGAERLFGEERWRNTAFAPLGAGECASSGELEICAVAVQHEGNRLHPFKGRVGALGYVVRDGSSAFFFAGDTGATMDFEHVRDTYRPRLAILPVGAWLPRFPMKHYHLSPEEAAEAGARLGVETVIPCHFGTFTLSLDAPSWALPRFAEAARARTLSWRMPRLMTMTTTTMEASGT